MERLDRADNLAGGTAAPTQLGDYATFLRRQWWLIVMIALLGLGAGAAYTSWQTPLYTSVTEVLVTATGVDDQSALSNGRTRGEINLDTEAQLVTSTEVITLAGQTLRQEAPGDELAKQVRVSVPPNTEVLAIAFTSGSAERARLGAEAIAAAYLDNRSDAASAELAAQRFAREALLDSLRESLLEVTDTLAALPPESPLRAVSDAQVLSLNARISVLDAELSQLDVTPVSPGRVITAATLPKAPSSPVLPLNLAGGAMVGLLLGCGLAVLRHRSDHFVRASGDVTRRTGVPVLASIPQAAKPDRQILADVTSAAGLGYTRLRNVITTAVGPGQRVILVAAVAGDAGEVAANLVASLARTGGDVVLVSTDAASTAAFRLLMTGDSSGISEVLAGEMPAEDAMQGPAEPRNLQVLSLGRDPERAAALLQTPAAGELLATLSSTARYVVVEAPPTSTSGQAQTLAALADVVVVVVHNRSTRGEDLLDAADQFAAVRTPVLGCVVVPDQRVRGRRWFRTPAKAKGEADPPVLSSKDTVSSGQGPEDASQHRHHTSSSARKPSRRSASVSSS